MDFAHIDLVLLKGACRADLRRQRLVRVKHGVALRVPDDVDGLRAWQKRGIITRARLLAVAWTMRTPLVFTRQSAAILHGIETWGTNPPVSFSTAVRVRSRALPPVALGGVELPASRTHPMVDVAPRSTVLDIGLEASNLEDTAVDCALDLPPLEALVIVSGVLRRLSAFDRFERPASDGRARRARAAIVQRLDEVGADSRRTEAARLIIELADAACESVGERVLHFVLLSLFPAITRTQVEVRTNGKRYFLDFAIPGLMIAFEFDGVIKMGDDEEGFRKAQAELLARQRNLEDAGWTVVRFGWNDLLDLSAVRDKLFRRIIAVAKCPMIPDSRTQELWTTQLAQRDGSRMRAARRRRQEATTSQ